MPAIRNGSYGRGNGLRSSEWFDRRDLDGFLHRSWLKSTGVTNETFRGRPVIGICNSWSELVNCNVHLRGLAEAVKRGVLQASGFPLEFPVISLGWTGLLTQVIYGAVIVGALIMQAFVMRRVR